MADWTTCPTCHLEQVPRSDGRCARCQEPLVRRAAAAAVTAAPATSLDTGACHSCGRSVPTHPVVFRQNIGALIMRFYKTVEGRLCAECVQKHFLETTLITLVAGWWGIVSFFATPFILIANVSALVEARAAFRRGPSATSAAPSRDLAMIAFVLGVLSFVCIPVVPALGGLPLGGLPLGAFALYKAQQEPDAYGGSGFAIAGIVLSLASLVITSAAILLLIFAPPK